MDRTFIAHPATKNERTPIVVIAMHLWGVDEPMRAAARRFAEHGIAAIVPDLYANFDAPDGDGVTDHTVFLPLARSLVTEQVDMKLAAGRDHMRTLYPKAKTAIAGFCMGGVMATFRSTSRYDYDAAAVWYGLSKEIDASDVTIPIVASYGSLDRGIPVADVLSFEQSLRTPHDIKVYDGADHAFGDEARAAYHRDATEDTWQRTLLFLKRYLL